MGKFSLENKIKDRLEGHEVHIDKRELWNSLGIEEEKKDRKGIWFWWFAGLFAIVLTAGIWWVGQKDGFDVSDIQETSVIEIDENLAKTGNETIAETSTSEKLSNIIKDVKSQDGQSENFSNQPNQQNSRLEVKNVSPASASGFRNESNRNTLAQENRSTLLQENRIFNTNAITESKTVNTEIEKTEKGDMIPSQIIMIENLPQVNSMLSYDREVETLEAGVEVNPLIKPIAKSRKFEFELYGGVGSINREFSTSNRDFDSYIAGRDSSESTLEQVSLGASLKYIIGGGFYSKVGIGVNRWNEQFTYNITSDTLETKVPIPDIILIDLQGNSTTTKFTEGIQTTYTITDWVRYNRLTQIDLPVSLGYERRLNRWSVFGEASAIFNVRQKFSGYLYAPNGELAKDPELFKSAIGLNFGVNAGVGYGITPRIRARVSARYYRSLGSVLLSDNGIEQKYSSLGLRVGVGYLF